MLMLASASPRRQELLCLITSDFTVFAPQADEHIPNGVLPCEAVEILAKRKARKAALMYPGDVIIGADTVVVINGQILGKPHDAADAARMLRLLSGNTHEVFTGVCVLSREKEVVFHERTEVMFFPLSDSEIMRYAGTGEPLDKAGAYGIQGKAALFIKGINGDYYNVMGLPVAGLYRVLSGFGAV